MTLPDFLLFGAPFILLAGGLMLLALGWVTVFSKISKAERVARDDR